jgi:hypothetical protein
MSGDAAPNGQHNGQPDPPFHWLAAERRIEDWRRTTAADEVASETPVPHEGCSVPPAAPQGQADGGTRQSHERRLEVISCSLHAIATIMCVHSVGRVNDT